MPISESTALKLARMAHRRQRDDIAIKILKHFDTVFPESAVHEKAQQLLGEIENESPGH